MKTFKLIGAVLLIAILCANFSACSNDPIIPEVTVEMGNEDYFVKNMVFDSSAGEKTFSFNSNVEWTVSVAPTMDGEKWCIVTPNSGIEGKNSIRVQVQENTEYDDRSVVLTLTAGSSLTKTITVTQKQKDAIFISNKKYEVGSKGETIEVELNTNVDLDIVIKDSWIKQTESRGMINRKLYFQVEANENYDARSADVIISDKNKNITDTIIIYQYQKDTIIIKPTTFEMSAIGGNIEATLKTNIDYQVNIPDEYSSWIQKEIQTRALNTNKHSFIIKKNNSMSAEPRIGYIFIESGLGQDTISIIQEAPIYVAEAGTLSDLLTKSSSEYVNLIITGELNNKDFLTLKQLHNLSILDLENIKNTEMPANVFEGKESLSKITFPHNLIKIPDLACHKCKNLTQIEYFEKVKEIGERSFLYCNLNGTLFIKDNVTSIGEHAFQENKLDSIIIGSGLTQIKSMTFSYNRTLRYLELGKNVETLEVGCFNSCDSLSGYIIFPEKVKKIGRASFTAYDPLKYVKGFICKNPNPPLLEADAFPNYDYLQVPLGSKSEYEQAPNWSNFLVIEEVNF